MMSINIHTQETQAAIQRWGVPPGVGGQFPTVAVCAVKIQEEEEE